MSVYGIEIRDSAGNIIVDNSYLLHRVWLKGTFSTNQTITYSAPLTHEPTVCVYGINGEGCRATHVTSGGNFTGVTLNFDGDMRGNLSLVIVFARR